MKSNNKLSYIFEHPWATDSLVHKMRPEGQGKNLKFQHRCQRAKGENFSSYLYARGPGKNAEVQEIMTEGRPKKT